MRKLIVIALAAMFVASFAASVMAFTWDNIGTSSWTMTSASIQDAKRIKFSSVVVDENGNVFVAANGGENNGQAGGLTILHYNKQNNTYTTENVDISQNFPGAITKLVVGGGAFSEGGGRVFALQNFQEIEYGGDRGVANRILMIDVSSWPSASTVTKIWCPDPLGDGCNVGDLYRIGDITVGGDGNLYWTTSGREWAVEGPTSYKYHFFWRYDWATTNVEESPTKTYGNGYNQTDRMFNFQYLGDGMFTVLHSGGDTWAADYMTWTTNRTPGYSCTSWGRDWITAMAYDKVNKKLWTGGRGKNGSSSTYGGGPWSWSGTSSFMSFADLGSGNKGIRFNKNTGTSQNYYRMNYASGTTIGTAAMKFKVDAYSADLDGALLQMRLPQIGAAKQQTFQVMISGGNYVVNNWTGNVVTLGPVVTGVFNTVYMVFDGNTSKLEVWWNGTKKYDAAVTNGNVYYGWGAVMFGGCTRDSGSNGTVDVTFDWVGYAASRITPGDEWPNIMGYWLSCSILPDQYYQTCIMSKFNSGAAGYQFNGCQSWHANGNVIDQAGTNTPNGARYWVQSLAVDPTGTAWMGFGADPGYSYDNISEIRTVTKDAAGPTGSKGVPEAGAYVMALGFDKATPYAVTVDVSGASAAYKIWKGHLATGSVAEIKAGSAAGDVVATNEEKIVTYTYQDFVSGAKYFYIQDKDPNTNKPYGGIKVNLASGDMPAVGDSVSVQGIISVINDEAVIDGACISSSTAAAGTPAVVATNIRGLGGQAIGAQPAVAPAYGLNTVGMLVRITGEVKSIVTDDAGFTFFTLEDGSVSSTVYNDPVWGSQTVEGVKCLDKYASGGYSFNVGDKVTVTGVLGMESAVGTIQRVVECNSADIVIN